jgi:hypothetical protein
MSVSKPARHIKLKYKITQIMKTNTKPRLVQRLASNSEAKVLSHQQLS